MVGGGFWVVLKFWLQRRSFPLLSERKINLAFFFIIWGFFTQRLLGSLSKQLGKGTNFPKVVLHSCKLRPDLFKVSADFGINRIKCHAGKIV